jgi:hypothetical protein
VDNELGELPRLGLAQMEVIGEAGLPAGETDREPTAASRDTGSASTSALMELLRSLLARGRANLADRSRPRIRADAGGIGYLHGRYQRDSCCAWRTNNEAMEVEGCLLVFCRTQLWPRVTKTGEGVSAIQ